MSSSEILKKHLFALLDEYNDVLSKYKELRAKGLAKDENFEAVIGAKKQLIAELLDMIK